MSKASRSTIAAVVSCPVLVVCLGTTGNAAVRELPVDRLANVSGVTVACTGIGQGEEAEARWNAYPVRLQAVGAYGQYLGDVNLTLRNCDGSQFLDVGCAGPWMMLQLQPGRYSGTMTAPGTYAHHLWFSAPKHGQRDIIVRFLSKTTGRERLSTSSRSS